MREVLQVSTVVRSAHNFEIAILQNTDPYENIYTVIRGTKHFLLFPPSEGWCLQGTSHSHPETLSKEVHPALERMYSSAKYTRALSRALILAPNTPTQKVRWSSRNLSYLDPTFDPPHSSPLRISVDAGETLYLPVGWWHHVSQSTDPKPIYGGRRGRCIAINWWYDTEMRGMNWVWLSFLRELGDPTERIDEGKEIESLSK